MKETSSVGHCTKDRETTMKTPELPWPRIHMPQ
jgi:hypothetical protein